MNKIPKLYIDDFFISEIFETTIPRVHIHMRDEFGKLNYFLATKHFMDFLDNVLKENNYDPKEKEYIKTAEQVFKVYAERLKLSPEEKSYIWMCWSED